MRQIVKVRIRKVTRIFPAFVRDIPLSKGDACVVRSDRGLEHAVCVAPPQDCPEGEGIQNALTVVRKASYRDEATLRKILEDENRAREVCTRRIQARNLPMKLVDVEYTFDQHKIIFYFTAEDRVDFRDLVRDLARELKARIELRHIQVRDESKLVGALAACGRELCCATWLPGFMPISMKMAKRQNLSLNPSKISGQCGRLMCCLSYENDQYEPKRRKPQEKQGQQVEAPAGPEEDEAGVPLQGDAAVEDLGHGEEVVAVDLSEETGEPSAKPATQEPGSPAPPAGEREQQKPEAQAAEKLRKKRRRRPRKRRRRRGRSGQGDSDSNTTSKQQ